MALRKIEDVVEEYNRTTFLIYGGPGQGKTYMALKVAEQEPTYYFPIDRGLREAMQKYKRGETKYKMVICDGETKQEILKDIKDIKSKISKNIASGKWKPYSTWVFIDTITQLQNKFMEESLKMAAGGRSGSLPEGSSRDMPSNTDWGVILGWMNQVVSALIEIPANIVFIGLEKIDDHTKEPIVQLSGQGQGVVRGLSDVITRLMKTKKGVRKLILSPDENKGDARVRGDGVLPVEPADLLLLRDKLQG